MLDLALADEIFTAATPDDVAQLRILVAEFRSDVMPRISRLRSAVGESDLAAVKRELHQIRGVVANFAFSRAAERLRDLEGTWTQLGAAERGTRLDAIERDVQAGLLALNARFSFLAS